MTAVIKYLDVERHKKCIVRHELDPHLTAQFERIWESLERINSLMARIKWTISTQESQQASKKQKTSGKS
jgi:hypothetical protein